MTRVPSPLRRVWRDRPRLIAVALLALVSLAAAGISATAAERLQSVLDANWRGTYDILVTAKGSNGDLAGLLAPNTLAGEKSALTLDDVAKIRNVSDVGVAAPIGEVVVPGLILGQVQIALPKDAVDADTQPRAFRITMTFWTDDGLGERFVSHETYDVVIDKRPRPEPAPGSCNINGVDVTPETYPELSKTCDPAPHTGLINFATPGGWGSSGAIEGDSIVFGLGNAMMPSTRVTLVDPVAERALLGKAGEFLGPLADLDAKGTLTQQQVVDWAKATQGKYGDQFLKMYDQQVASNYGYTPEQLKEYERLNKDPAATSQLTFPVPPYVPLLVRDAGPAPLEVSIDVSGYGEATDDRSSPHFATLPYTLPPAMQSGAPGTAVGSSEVDASSLLNPANSRPVILPWPGTRADGILGESALQTMAMYFVGKAASPVFTVEGTQPDGVKVKMAASGYLYPWVNEIQQDDVLPLLEDGTVPGRESVFASGLKFRTSVDPGQAANGELAPNAVAVGGFSLDGIDKLQSGLSRVPLGAYESVGSTLIPGSSAAATKAVTMNPSVTGFGLVSQQTVAIASLNSAAAWGDKAPVNAVRVRVSGVNEYSPDAVAKIAAVAQAINKLGFSATVVSGSSPTDVTVDVDNYAFGVTTADEKQKVGPLGSVTQKWSELGAASRVNLAVSNTSFAILAVALGAAALLLAAVQLAGVPDRRAQASVMRTIGWRRRRIVRWMAAEELVSLVIIAIAGVVALLLASSRSAVTIAVGGSVAALMVTSTLAVALGARPLATGIRPLRRGKRRHRMAEVQAWVTSLGRLALRQVSVHRLNGIVQLIATIVVAVAAAAITVTLIEGRAAAGASALGVFAVDEAFVAQLALGAIALIAGIVLAAIARRIDLVRRREQWSTMRAMGWSVGQVRTVQIIEGALIGVPAIVIASGVVWVYLGQVAQALTGIGLMIAVAATVILTVVLVLTSWREKK